MLPAIRAADDPGQGGRRPRPDATRGPVAVRLSLAVVGEGRRASRPLRAARGLGTMQMHVANDAQPVREVRGEA